MTEKTMYRWVLHTWLGRHSHPSCSDSNSDCLSLPNYLFTKVPWSIYVFNVSIILYSTLGLHFLLETNFSRNLRLGRGKYNA
jgi:hypothetical protein